MATETNLLINGVAIECVDARDRGLHYGDGVFETLAVVQGECALWAQHMQRLKQGCQRLSLSMPDEAVLKAECQRLIKDVTQAVIKIIITRGVGTRGYQFARNAAATRIVSRHPWPAYPARYWQEGVKVRLCHTRLACNPALAGIKHLNRLEQVLARNEWDDETIAEGLMCDNDGYIIEGTMSNLFIVNHGTLFTPDISRCGVAGVMRAQVLELAKTCSLDVKIENMHPQRVQQADEVFLSNSLIGLWPVQQFENSRYAVGPVTQQLMAKIQ